MRPDFEVLGAFPKESSRIEKPKVVLEVETCAAIVALKKAFINVLTSSKKFMGINPMIQEVLFDG
jgi:hypothetical protein